MNNKIDRHGKCPNCSTDWDGGDVYEVMSKLHVFMNTSANELKKIVANYGWTEEAPVRFSKTINHQIGMVVYYRCPNIRCGHVFNAETGEEFDSIVTANRTEKAIDSLAKYCEDNPKELQKVVFPELIEEMKQYADDMAKKEEEAKTVTEAVNIMFNTVVKSKPNGTDTTGNNKGFGGFFRQIKK